MAQVVDRKGIAFKAIPFFILHIKKELPCQLIVILQN